MIFWVLRNLWTKKFISRTVYLRSYLHIHRTTKLNLLKIFTARRLIAYTICLLLKSECRCYVVSHICIFNEISLSETSTFMQMTMFQFPAQLIVLSHFATYPVFKIFFCWCPADIYIGIDTVYIYIHIHIFKSMMLGFLDICFIYSSL